MGVLCCYFRPTMFSPGDHVRYHSRTLGAHVLATVVGSSITFVLDETHWHRINAKVASHVFSLLASAEGTTVCLKYPCNPPPPPGDQHLATVSPPPNQETAAR